MKTNIKQLCRLRLCRLLMVALALGCVSQTAVAETRTGRTLQKIGPYDTGGARIGSGIFNKWRSMGGRNGQMGRPFSHEKECTPSKRGTTGTWVSFTRPGSKAGQIIWHRNGKYAGRVFAVYGAIAHRYVSLGGTGSWLGFPISDEFDALSNTVRISRFERGYIQWSKKYGTITVYGY